MLVRSPKAAPAAALFLASLFWGVATVICKAILHTVPPITFLIVQLIPSVAGLWLIVLAGRMNPLSKRMVAALALLGLLSPGLTYILSMLGLARASVSVATLFWATEPAMIAVLAWVILREALTARLLAAISLAFLGVFLVGSASADAIEPPGIWASALLLGGVASSALYTVLSRKLARSADPLFILALQQSVALVLICGISPLQPGGVSANSFLQLSMAEWAGAVVSGLMYYAFAFWFYLYGLRSFPASIVGGFLNLIPVFAIATAYVALGERLTAGQWGGAVIVLLAVCAILAWMPQNDRQAVR